MYGEKSFKSCPLAEILTKICKALITSEIFFFVSQLLAKKSADTWVWYPNLLHSKKKTMTNITTAVGCCLYVVA